VSPENDKDGDGADGTPPDRVEVPGSVAEPSVTGARAPIAGPLAVEAVDITKRFPGVVANSGVSFSAATGEVHALLGENGAGKSTLCGILTGIYRPDEGQLRVNGVEVRFRSPRDAHRAGIGMVHQHFRLVPSMTVAENVVLGDRSAPFRFRRKAIEDQVARVAERYRIAVNPKASVWQLSLGEQQRVEILKALHRGAKILLLDEPTAVLTPGEVEALFESVRHLVADGGTVVFVSHKLPEVMAIADRVTVLRRGRTVGSVAVADTSPRGLASMMVGREVEMAARQPEPIDEAAPVVLDLRGVHAAGDRGRPALQDVSLRVRAGEILGVAGVAGNGQKELAEVVAGLRPRTAGTVVVGGTSLPGDPRSAIDAGVAFVPEDRMGVGVAGALPIADNAVLKTHRRRPFTTGPLLRRRRIGQHARTLMTDFDIRAPGPRTLVRQLSGGNVQKVVLAHELDSDPTVLVAQSPTHGLDVGAIDAVRRIMLEAADRGVGILLISEDLDEVLDMSDRIAVMYEGRVVDEFPAGDADVERIGRMMAGDAP
jgi:simple sugar transport system ATP-binding protein